MKKTATKDYYFVIIEDGQTRDAFCMTSNLPPDVVRCIFYSEAFLRDWTASGTESRMWDSQERYEKEEKRRGQVPVQAYRLDPVVV